MLTRTARQAALVVGLLLFFFALVSYQANRAGTVASARGAVLGAVSPMQRLLASAVGACRARGAHRAGRSPRRARRTAPATACSSCPARRVRRARRAAAAPGRGKLMPMFASSAWQTVQVSVGIRLVIWCLIGWPGSKLVDRLVGGLREVPPAL